LHSVGLKIILKQLTFYRRYDSLDGKLRPNNVCNMQDKTKQHDIIQYNTDNERHICIPWAGFQIAI
jgi:hypothetical protein